MRFAGCGRCGVQPRLPPDVVRAMTVDERDDAPDLAAASFGRAIATL
jgi:hypothetical protein